MSRDEIERLKEEEKAHLKKVRALKQQLREANRKKGLLDALRGLDTSALDETHEEMLRKVTEKNMTSEARFEMAMDALDEAEREEATRAEMARLDAERQKADAADLVQQMKTQMLGDAAEHAEAQQPSEAERPTASEIPQKSIGPAAARDKPAADASEAEPEPEARSGKTIGRFRPDTERD